MLKAIENTHVHFFLKCFLIIVITLSNSSTEPTTYESCDYQLLPSRAPNCHWLYSSRNCLRNRGIICTIPLYGMVVTCGVLLVEMCFSLYKITFCNTDTFHITYMINPTRTPGFYKFAVCNWSKQFIFFIVYCSRNAPWKNPLHSSPICSALDCEHRLRSERRHEPLVECCQRLAEKGHETMRKSDAVPFTADPHWTCWWWR